MGRHNKKPVEKGFYSVLESVTTISEAARLWYLGKTTIRNAIETEQIAAVKSGNIWLISVPSMVNHYGVPPKKAA